MRSSAHSSSDRGRSRFARGAAPPRQHVLADHPLRARGHARERRSRARLRAGLRPRPGDRACCSRCSGDWSARTQPRPELMDSERVDLATFEACLKDLERINRWTGAYRITLGWLERTAQGPRAAAARSGRHRLGLRRHAAPHRHLGRGARRVALDLLGRSQSLTTTIAARATPSTPVRYLTADVFELSPALRPDAVISSLFAHHLDDRQLVRFLQWMEASARLGWLINDLHRHPIAYGIARWAPHLLRMNRLVRHDAAVSVARSCARRDWERLLATAGVAGPPTTVSWRFPFATPSAGSRHHDGERGRAGDRRRSGRRGGGRPAHGGWTAGRAVRAHAQPRPHVCGEYVSAAPPRRSSRAARARPPVLAAVR